MGKKVVLLLQEGGALGAIQCGVRNALFPFIRDDGHELAAVAGAQIGAIKAGLIACNFHDVDGSKTALRDFWRNHAATPQAPLKTFGRYRGNGPLLHRRNGC